MQVSLREMLTIVAFVAIGTASLKVDGLLSSIFVALALLLCMAMAVMAVVDRGPRQAFAIGFVICALVYGTVVFASRATEFQPHAGRLPTSQLLTPLYEAIVKRTWIDGISGKELPNYQPEGSGDSAVVAANRLGISLSAESPGRITFMSVGHILWALVFSYAGGKFGQFTYSRRVREFDKTGLREQADG
jgi:hypothetical protein